MSDTITEALERFKTCNAAEADQREREEDDLAFQIPANHWTPEAKANRGQQVITGPNGITLPARPMLSFPTLDQPIQLVLNQERAAKLGVEVHALNEEADDDTAEVLQGLYRRIEVDSRAGLARTWAFDRGVKAGRGVYRVLTEFDPDGGHPSDQRIVIKRILYQGCVYLDPFAQEPDWSDGEWGLVVEDMPWKKFTRKYKDSKVALASESELQDLGSEQPGWINGGDEASRTVRVAEYFRKIYTTKRHEGEGEWAGRDYDDCKVVWSLITALEELTPPKDWPGKYIPLIPVIGRELQPVQGKRVWVGVIGPNKDAARTVDYSATGMVEAAALEPRAPFDIDPEEIEGYETWWQQANIRNFPFLPRKKILHGQPTGALQRIQADGSKLGLSHALLEMSTDMVRSGTGAYRPSLGETSGTQESGKKVLALQQQHDQTSGDFIDNLAELSMTLEAKIVLDLMAPIYDRPGRIARILGIEDKPQTVMLNQPYRMNPQTKRPAAIVSQPGQPLPAGDDIKHYDLKKGRYGVTVSVNKRYESRLQQGAEEIGQIMQAEPALIPIIGPTYFKFRDGPGMREIADLLKKMRDHQMPWLADEDSKNDPRQQLGQLQQENAMLKQTAQEMGKALETKQIEAETKLKVTAIQEASETQRSQAKNETAITVAELGAKIDRLSLFLEERARLGVQGHEQAMGHADAEHERMMAEQQHQQALEQGQQAHDQGLEAGQMGHEQTLDQQAQAAALAPQPETGA